jgi:hypothetical protein
MALEELEGHGHAELLPDRIEVHRRNGRRRRSKRIRSANVTRKVVNAGGLINEAENVLICQRIGVD